MNELTYRVLHSLVFQPMYPGYRPTVRELPNGDGKVDVDKKYAHVAEKYIKDFNDLEGRMMLDNFLDHAHVKALQVAKALNVPTEFMPKREFGALRILDYPPGAISNLHTDFDLFTIMVYRDQPECFVAHDHSVIASDADLDRELRVLNAREINKQLHLGEIGELIGLGKATPHEVIASPTTQHSVVYFAIPDHKAVLPTGQTVGEWLEERMARSRASGY